MLQLSQNSISDESNFGASDSVLMLTMCALQMIVLVLLLLLLLQ